MVRNFLSAQGSARSITCKNETLTSKNGLPKQRRKEEKEKLKVIRNE